ncbi:SRPBCC family protein [Actinoplanes sp. L3-i22]|uniref:SRPBCC family protein n=1 Tax=Actinoplanes sp. L3-i22 TaxID=2836373 RepID=UPI001C74E6C9|nr:SRPBCC family protein [Actinoplanes sp. L3-i22]BCY11397.1 hypothetical protein L3i22_064850 [Actinoplanes sp. L3-i22]
MTSANPGKHLLGSLYRLPDGRGGVRVEDVYDTGIDDLWSAVTDPARLVNWIAEVTGDLTVGGAVKTIFTSGWSGPGRIDVCEVPHRLLVTLAPGTDEETVIEAELFAEGERTRLVVEERGLPAEETFYHGAGWQAHLEDLAAHLAGQPAGPWKERWQELTPAYRELA